MQSLHPKIASVPILKFATVKFLNRRIEQVITGETKDPYGEGNLTMDGTEELRFLSWGMLQAASMVRNEDRIGNEQARVGGGTKPL